METFGTYLLALLLTLAIESPVAWLFGFRTVRSQLAVAMINCMTNPALNFLILVLNGQGVEVSLTLIILLEILVVVIEWQLLVYVFSHPKGRLFVLALVANAASFLTGVLLFWK
jgi:hypothetical protein